MDLVDRFFTDVVKSIKTTIGDEETIITKLGNNKIIQKDYYKGNIINVDIRNVQRYFKK